MEENDNHKALVLIVGLAISQIKVLRKEMLEYCEVANKTHRSNVLMSFIRRIHANLYSVAILSRESIKQRDSVMLKLPMELVLRNCIEAYYRCLVRSHTPDISILNELMDAMHHSYDPHHQVMFETMQTEFVAYVDGKVTEAKKQLIDLIENPSNAYKSYPLRSLKELCGREDKQTYQCVIKRLKIAEVENDFDVKEDIEI